MNKKILGVSLLILFLFLGIGLTTAQSGSIVRIYEIIHANSTKSISFHDINYGLREVILVPSLKAQDVKVTAIRYDSKPADVADYSKGKVYKYFKIESENIENKKPKIEIRVKVDDKWIADNNIAKEEIALYGYSNNAWVLYETSFVEMEMGDFVFKADAPGFGFFVIAQKEKSSPPAVEVEKENSETVSEPIVEVEKESGSNAWVILLIIVVVGIVYFILRKYKKR